MIGSPPRRRHIRREVALWAIEREGEARHFHQVLNASRSGLFLRESFPKPEGEHFPVEIPLPTGRTLQAHGIVVRTVWSGGQTGNGVVLIGLDPADEAAFDEYLSGIP